jgi:hypothetical protein
MKKQGTKLSIEEQLLEARERGIQEALQVNAMCAHGKVLGMDTFSWINPQVDMLATVIESLPFNIIWIGNHAQIKTCLETHPDTINTIHTLIVQDDTSLNVDRTSLEAIQSVTCVKGTQVALEFVKPIKQQKSAFLFTAEGPTAKAQKDMFEQFISRFK